MGSLGALVSSLGASWVALGASWVALGSLLGRKSFEKTSKRKPGDHGTGSALEARAASTARSERQQAQNSLQGKTRTSRQTCRTRRRTRRAARADETDKLIHSFVASQASSFACSFAAALRTVPQRFELEEASQAPRATGTPGARQEAQATTLKKNTQATKGQQQRPLRTDLPENRSKNPSKIHPRRPQNRPQRLPNPPPEASRSLFGKGLPFLVLFWSSGAPLGALLGRSWRLLGPSWGFLGVSWARPGRSWNPFWLPGEFHGPLLGPL